MIKTTHTLICDHCNEEILNEKVATIVCQGRFIGLDNQFTTVNLDGNAQTWHFHITCYDEQRYQTGNSKMPYVDRDRSTSRKGL